MTILGALNPTPTERRVPTLIGRRRNDATTTNGWITETAAGIVDATETPRDAAIRECLEETGYHSGDPRLIATFFSSPGGSSERVFLYFAEVRDADRIGPGGGIANEDIAVLHVPVGELLAHLAAGAIDDPKLIIGAYWLKDHLRGADSAAGSPYG